MGSRSHTPSRLLQYLPTWVGLGLIFLAAALNLSAVVAAQYAPSSAVGKFLVKYEEKKPAVTLALVAGGLVLVLRDVLVQLKPVRAEAPPAEVEQNPFVLTRADGGVPLVCSRYVEMSQHTRAGLYS